MKKHIKRYIVIALCAVIVACSTIPIMTVEASGGNSLSDIEKRVVDVSLTHTGVVANDDMLAYTREKIKTIMSDAIVAFNQYAVTSGAESVDVPLFYEFVQASTSDSVGQEVAKMLNYDIIDPQTIVQYVNNYDEVINMNIDMYKMFTGKNVEEEKNVTLSDEVVDYIRELFEECIEMEADYVWVPTLKPSDINIMWFTDKRYYDALKQLVTNSEYPLLVRFYQNKASKWFSTDSLNEYVTDGISIWVLNKPFGIIRNCDSLETTNYIINTSIYDDMWQKYKCPAFIDAGIGALETMTVDNMLTWGEYETNGTLCNLERFVNGYGYAWIMTNDGHKVKVFKNINAYKSHTVGREPYYITDISDSYNNTDNSVSVGGDYVTGGSYQYSHDVVQNEIDNSQNVDNSVVNNIVNNNQQTIVNNYASTVIPDSGSGNGGNDDGGGGLLDGLGGLIGGVTDFLGFIFGMLGDAISLVTSLFNTIFEGIKALGNIFTGFTGLLGDLFGFIPSELINFLVLAVEAGVAVTLWKQFKK